jgi:hypothetical protein
MKETTKMNTPDQTPSPADAPRAAGSAGRSAAVLRRRAEERLQTRERTPLTTRTSPLPHLCLEPGVHERLSGGGPRAFQRQAGFRFDPPHPGGMTGNSPTFQRWVREFREAQVPKGRLKPCTIYQPSLRDLSCCGRWFPTLKRWAIIRCPSGTNTWPGSSIPRLAGGRLGLHRPTGGHPPTAQATGRPAQL